MKVLDLFSGIGGFSIGLERAGMETIAFCEIDPFCRKVLRKHWPDVPIHEDIKTLAYAPSADARGGERLSEGQESSDGQSPLVLFDASRGSGESGSGDNHGGCELFRGTIDLICGGFPCQPFSHAGKRAGKEDDRHLWPEMCRVISEVQPAWVLGENVAGIIGMELDQVLSDLEALGYSTGTFVIPACAVDAPHRRDRVWIVANASSGRWGRENKGKIQQSGRAEVIGSSKRAARLQVLAGLKRWRQGEDVADASSTGRRPEGVASQKIPEPGAQQRSAGCAGGERSEWLPEPPVGRVAHGIPSRVHRLRALGNAVVPQVVEVIGRAILENER